ncbi:hypothetical protein [Agarivorans sp. QJM3NY_33]|uniref:hypothetical protein n=1 Tax=Agarivorans sp. QJM3NY_33 TaxID=3421432 RepID=UPI003D7EF3EC
MPSSAVAELLKQAEDQLVQIESLFTQEQVSPVAVQALLDNHQRLFSDFFATSPSLLPSEKQAIVTHVKRMESLLKTSAELKQQVERQMGTLKRSKLINKAYGK